jgi:hypothetical protein
VQSNFCIGGACAAGQFNIALTGAPVAFDLKAAPSGFLSSCIVPNTYTGFFFDGPLVAFNVAPSSLQLGGCVRLTVSTTAVAGAAIFVDVDGESVGVCSSATFPGTTSLTVANIDTSKRYTFKVRGYNRNLISGTATLSAC